MADLLLELFSEEIPARMQKDAMEHLANALQQGLSKAGFKAAAPKKLRYAAPHRCDIKDMPAASADIDTELKGPKVGAPEQAIQGFLKKSGMALEQLTQQDGIYVAKIQQKGKPTAEILKPLIEDILKNFPWPKSMRWGK